MPVRIYLTGNVCIESDGRLISERMFAGNQARLLFAVLSLEHDKPHTKDELAGSLWPAQLPAAWERALTALISKLRALLEQAGFSRGDALPSTFGCYQLRLPSDVWIDVEAAEAALELANNSLKASDPRAAYGWALTTYMICRRPFLPGEDSPWTSQKRNGLRALLVRSIDLLIEIYKQIGDKPMAIKLAEEVLDLEPYHETGYQQLIRLHASMGNRAEALRAYERCRRFLADELGTGPCPETEAAYLDALKA